MSKIKHILNGQEVTREEFVAGSRADYLNGGSYFVPNTYSEHDPLISEGLGCMKKQVPAMRQMIESEGIQGVKILDSGQARITSRRGRNHLIRALSEIRGFNLHDTDGGYGDA
jgi:hypothetical protein